MKKTSQAGMICCIILAVVGLTGLAAGVAIGLGGGNLRPWIPAIILSVLLLVGGVAGFLHFRSTAKQRLPIDNSRRPRERRF